MSDTSASRHVSYEQMKMIVDFMGQHVEFATGGLRSLEARHTSKRLWTELTKSLNNCRSGTKKTSDGWSKYWSDFKNKLKNKARIFKKSKSGSSFKNNFKALTKLEKRALIILGPHFNKRKSRVVHIDDPISDNKCSKNKNLQPKVKQESYHETLKNDYESEINDTHAILSGGDRDSDPSTLSSDEEFVDETADISNGHLLQNLYPEWLIEVEKKRVDAELLRAKAEQQRATVAAKNAEAAVIQAEALKKLSEAAERQADAMTRIAALLESLRCRDVLLNI